MLPRNQAEYHDGLKAVEDRKRAEKLALREALDRSLTDKCATSQRKVEQEKAEEEEIEVFTKAKRVRRYLTYMYVCLYQGDSNRKPALHGKL